MPKIHVHGTKAWKKQQAKLREAHDARLEAAFASVDKKRRERCRELVESRVDLLAYLCCLLEEGLDQG